MLTPRRLGPQCDAGIVRNIAGGNSGRKCSGMSKSRSNDLSTVIDSVGVAVRLATEQPFEQALLPEGRILSTNTMRNSVWICSSCSVLSCLFCARHKDLSKELNRGSDYRTGDSISNSSRVRPSIAMAWKCTTLPLTDHTHKIFNTDHFLSNTFSGLFTS